MHLQHGFLVAVIGKLVRDGDEVYQGLAFSV